MKTETKTTKTDIIFDISKALIIIEKDVDLNEMFSAKYGSDFKLVHASINSGNGLKVEVEIYIKALFDGLILEKTALRNKYRSLGDVKPVVEVKDETPNKKNKVINRMRWGLRAITDDITDNFNGKSKQIHRTAKMIQELKKIFSRLEQITWKERFKEETLTDEQLRELSGAIETFNKKVESIVKPKK